MSIPVGLQIGLELTNFVAPLTKTAFRLGSLAVREAIERSGSDELTELKLAHILGRHRLDDVIATHFRDIVSRSSSTPLSHFMKELVLESGSGPTVTQALTCGNPALLSMVIQVSFLAWSHEHQSLSQALTQAIDDMLIESRAATSHGLNYVSLLGTVLACQQQTAGFSWAHHYAAIEDKILKELKARSTQERPAKRRKSRGGQSAKHVHQQSLSDRAMPYVILRGLIKSLDSVQRFPEDCILQLSCDRGISSVVLWCYHILGISVLVRLSDTLVHFGAGPYNVTIESCNSLEVSAVLLQRASENVPVFTLNRDDADPYIRCDQRKEARGFLRQILTSHGIEGDELIGYGKGLVSKCINHFDLNSSPPSDDTIKVASLSHLSQDTEVLDEYDTIQTASLNQSSQNSEDSNTLEQNVDYASTNYFLRPRILRAASFLLDIDTDDLCDDTIELVSISRKRNISWSAIVAVVYAFAKVGDLTGCELMPLSLDTFEDLSTETQSITDSEGLLRQAVPDTLQCFDLVCRLLLGSRFTKEYVSRAILISSHGWSVFLDIMEASDPTDAATGSLHIKPGVPARDGIRKARIIDGMTDFGIDATRELLFNSEPRISFWPGVWTAKVVGTHIGYHGQDAFTVVQSYDWAHSGQVCKKWRLGFREKQDMCVKLQILRKCPCETGQSEVERRRVIDRHLTWPVAAKMENDTTQTYVVKHPEDEWNASRIPERIFRCQDVWYFYVTGDGAARWLGLDNLDRLSLEVNDYPIIARGKGCCVSCAMKVVKGKALVLL
ncbi:hypothetical protein JX265_004783 [Neoarthrinium moseri]|uniref:Uncharacterized protein n=1 Tax=Neoarthrinium moseri TaxID=1658444 RepID=A0A9P9WPW7_9PEZI|nr:hypothetical protein JX265_004783 [Neoarthrinium moseri]